MKLRLMDFIVCPACKNPFTLKAHQTEKREYSQEWFDKVTHFWRSHRLGGPDTDASSLWESYCTEVMEGELLCEKCGSAYPIERGVPRILPPELRTLSGKMGRGDPGKDARIDKLMDEIQPVRAEQDDSLFREIQLANQSNYGYEWQAFSHEYELWDGHYKKNYVSEEADFFTGKFGLDAGCGMGRYTRPPIKNGAEMVGIDLSNAVEAAYAKSREFPTHHVVQGDIFNLPSREGYFDFAQSLGVIHITPDPEGALLEIKRAVKPGGNIYLYVYKTFKEDNLFKHYLLKPVTLMRRFTVKLPSNVLYYLLYLMVPPVLLFLYLPSWILWQFGATKKYSLMLPYNYEQYGHRRLRDMHMCLFDRFGNPVERRYDREEMEDWMKRAGFEHFVVKKGYGWNVTAIKQNVAVHR